MPSSLQPDTQLSFPLTQGKVHQAYQIIQFLADDVAATAIQFGLYESAQITLLATPMGGPLVLQYQGIELALARAICDAILVTPLKP